MLLNYRRVAYWTGLLKPQMEMQFRPKAKVYIKERQHVMLSISALDLLLSPANRMSVLKPSLGYPEHDTRLGQGESSFIPRY